jgi:DNA-binding MarR family transcriptional regulator
MHACRGREPADAAPDPDRSAPIPALFERGREDRERSREHHRGADALRESGGDQHPLAGGEPADHGGDAEQDRAGDKHPAAAEQVGGAATEQHESTVGEQVSAGDPHETRHGEVQIAADRRERDVDDRRVDEVKERTLARLAGLHPATITGILDRLEQGRWVARERDPSDRRAVLIRALTDRNADLMRLYSGMSSAVNKICAGYNDTEFELIADFLRHTASAGASATDDLLRD